MSTQHIGAKLTFLRILGGDGGRELISFISHHSTFNQNMMIEIGTYRVFQGFGQTVTGLFLEAPEGFLGVPSTGVNYFFGLLL